MREMIKSKGIILFILVFLGVTYVNAIGTVRMEESYKIENSYVALNTCLLYTSPSPRD